MSKESDAIPDIPLNKDGTAKLTPLTRRVIEDAMKYLKKGWTKGEWLTVKIKDDTLGDVPVVYDGYDDLTGPKYVPASVGHQVNFHDGYHNHDFVAACAVGGVQKALWEALGRPDMSKRDVRRKVEKMEHAIVKRLEKFTPAYTDDLGDPVAAQKSIMGFNDTRPEGTKGKKQVLAVFRKALGPK